MSDYFDDEDFDGIDYSQKGNLAKGEYDNCIFSGCNFANTDLSEITFTECEFRDCDLSMARITKSAFREVAFIGCKMLGMRFDNCNGFLMAVAFQNCQLNLSNFFKRELNATQFTSCSLRECDFSECDLSEADFSGSDLAGAQFDRTNLKKADLSTAHNYIIDPALNSVEGARFSLEGLPGLLGRYGIVVG